MDDEPYGPPGWLGIILLGAMIFYCVIVPRLIYLFVR